MTEVVRPAYGRVLSIAIGVLAVVMVVIAGIQGGWHDAAVTLPWALLLAVACWATFARPCVEVSDAGVRIVNVTRTIDVPWPALRGVETRWALPLDTSYGRFTAWSAPAPGKRGAVRVRSQRHRDPAGDAALVAAPGDLLDTPSGAAAAVVRDRWDALRAAGHLEDPRLEHPAAPVRWHWETLVVLVVLLIIGIATLS